MLVVTIATIMYLELLPSVLVGREGDIEQVGVLAPHLLYLIVNLRKVIYLSN